MAETIPGGVYADADGKGYHDANGKPVTAEDAAAYLKMAAENSKLAQAIEERNIRQQMANMAGLRNLVASVPALPAPSAPVKPVETPKPVEAQPVAQTETEPRNRGR